MSSQMRRNIDATKTRSAQDQFTALRNRRDMGQQSTSGLSWWYRLVALPEPRLGATLRERERSRHSHLIAIFLLAFVFVEAGGFFQFGVIDDDHPFMMKLLVVAFAVMIVISGLNRTGKVMLAGLLMVALADISLPAIPATGAVDVQHFGALYLSVGSLLVAASVLPAWSVFPLAIGNCALMLGIVFFLPHSAAFDTVLRSNDAQQIVAGPLLMQGIVAIVAFVWAQSMLHALQRADRAEEIALLEQRELERQAELEEGVRQLLDVHVRLANGDFQARSSGLRNPLLWSVGNSLNILIARLSRTAQADAILRREEVEAQRLADAIRVARSGQQPNLPTPGGVPMDIVVEALRSRPLTVGVTLSDASARKAHVSQSPMPRSTDDASTASGPGAPDWLRSHG
jgi:hypothetical protein